MSEKRSPKTDALRKLREEEYDRLTKAREKEASNSKGDAEASQWGYPSSGKPKRKRGRPPKTKG